MLELLTSLVLFGSGITFSWLSIHYVVYASTLRDSRRSPNAGSLLLALFVVPPSTTLVLAGLLLCFGIAIVVFGVLVGWASLFG
jgi:hypothetical protein